MEESANNTATIPAAICGFAVVSSLSDRGTFRAVGQGGRSLVLKKLDPDCLQRDLLHPHVRDRLARVRELPHAGVANLHGVGRDGRDAYLIWEFVEGIPFDHYAGAPGRSPREVAIAARELILTVGSLHLQGIVHGDLVAGNVIVSSDNEIHLTHVSPLLYTDSAVDITSVFDLLEYVVEARGESHSPLGNVIAEARRANLGLRELGVRLATLIESRDFEASPTFTPVDAEGPRRGSLVGAALAALAGVGVCIGVWATVQNGRLTLPRTLHLPQFADRDRD